MEEYQWLVLIQRMLITLLMLLRMQLSIVNEEIICISELLFKLLKININYTILIYLTVDSNAFVFFCIY
jgi:hypothetical protein